VQGLGSAGGFKMMLEDRAGLGSEALFEAARALVAAANKDPTFASAFTLFNAGSPSLYADIDRLKAEKVGLTPTGVFSTLQVYLGSQYVNDFNYLGRTYQVRVQGDGKFRRTPQDITRLKARNASVADNGQEPRHGPVSLRKRRSSVPDARDRNYRSFDFAFTRANRPAVRRARPSDWHGSRGAHGIQFSDAETDRLDEVRPCVHRSRTGRGGPRSCGAPRSGPRN